MSDSDVDMVESRHIIISHIDDRIKLALLEFKNVLYRGLVGVSIAFGGSITMFYYNTVQTHDIAAANAIRLEERKTFIVNVEKELKNINGFLEKKHDDYEKADKMEIPK